MSRLSKLTIVICLLSCFQTGPVFACRYNVRDVGFADLGSQPYYFLGFVDENTDSQITSTFRKISQAALMDTNIRFEIIDVHQQKSHPAIKYSDQHKIKSFPAAVLVSPEGMSLQVPVTKQGQPFKQTLWSVLDDIISSPKRREIVEKVIETYGIVLVVEGKNAQENTRVRNASIEAIETITSQMDMLPKAIANPPVMIEVEKQLFPTEKILLWSLEVDANEPNEPYVAILYARVRKMGMVLKGQTINSDRIARLLSVIGADCECGLDRKWMQGTMLPVKWDQTIQAQIAKNLGFDPENPMLQMEMSRILRRGWSSQANQQNIDSLPNLLPGGGYQEIVITFDPEPVENVEPAQQPTADSAPNIPEIPQPQQPLTPSQNTVALAQDSTFSNAIFLIIGVGVLVVIIGIAILSQSKRKEL